MDSERAGYICILIRCVDKCVPFHFESGRVGDVSDVLWLGEGRAALQRDGCCESCIGIIDTLSCL